MKRLTFASLMLLSVSVGAFDISLKKSPGAAEDAAAKRFEPDPAVARLYVFRDNAFLGRSGKSNLVIGNKIAATTGANEFAVIALPAGAYELTCVASQSGNALASLAHNRTKAPLPLTVEAGKVYAIQQVFRGARGFELHPVELDAARPLITKGKLVEDVRWK